ncbi:type II secretion system protein D [Arenimonas soli]|uniref:Type II secretion system protein D n=1 Tax=Arenimonas soli TaxID=2269504 RepID=A0ABQ1HRC0_9GAMM|nr:type II secretion system protein D [Arenimonas soli]
MPYLAGWLLAFALAGGAVAQSGPDDVTLNFVNTEIEGMVMVISEITGKNFVLDPRVKGTISIVSAKPLPREVVYDVFLSALRLQGYAAIETGGVVRIVPEADAKLYPGASSGLRVRASGGGDQVQTQAFHLKHQPAEQMLPILRPLIAPNNTITAHAGNNSLVITDYANNMPRLARIIAAMDMPDSSEPVVIPLHHASALDVAVTVNRLFAESAPAAAVAGAPPRFTVVADMRSNSLLARTSDPSRLSQLRRFVAMLDSPGNAGGNIHVVYLRNADAVKLAETLRAIHGADAGANMDSPTGAMLGAAVPAEVETAHGRTSGIIQADAATNSIIITAPDATYNNLRAVIEKLDVRRAQVYVEALIAEVTSDRAAEFGVQWQNLGGLDESGRQVFGGTNFGGTGENIIGLSQNPGSAGPGLNLGIINGRVNLPGIGEILNLGVLVRALETDANANILSTPTLLTLDNEEASIIIGQNVPFITGQYATTGGGATTPTPFQTIERQDVGLTLQVKPQISEGGTVRLQFYQEVSSINDISNPAGVITNKRAVSSTVLVEDGQIVVIGGLIQDATSEGVRKVPVLGSIPGIGGLFRSKKRGRSKTNLMIFLRITLVRDSAGADAYTGERYDYILGQQQATRPRPSVIFGDPEPPSLPVRPPPRMAVPLPEPVPMKIARPGR